MLEDSQHPVCPWYLRNIVWRTTVGNLPVASGMG